jgi:flagellar biosynthesis protein FliR
VQEPIPPLAVAGALALFRIGGLMLVAPLFSSRTVPRMLRAAFAVLLTVLMLPALPSLPPGLIVGPGALAAEMVVGLGIGFGAAALLAGAEMAGDVLAVQTGLSGATALDPLTGQGTGVLGQLLGLFALLVLLVTGGHLVMLEALAASYEIVPIGFSFNLSAGIMELVGMTSLLFSRGLQFAAPVIAAISVGYVALGVLARTSPQLNMLAVAFPLQIGLGLLILGAVLPMAATFYASWPAHIEGLSLRFLLALGGG